ncbi:hypothetical protein Trydic_g19917 [Trypoxylus dichotomus]
MNRFKEDLPLILVNAEKINRGKKAHRQDGRGWDENLNSAKEEVHSSDEMSALQKYGHDQFRCTAAFSCLRCPEDHTTYECPNKGSPRKQNAQTAEKTTTRPASSVPSIRKRKDAEKAKKIKHAENKPGISYSQVTASSKKQPPSEDPVKKFIALADEIQRYIIRAFL